MIIELNEKQLKMISGGGWYYNCSNPYEYGGYVENYYTMIGHCCPQENLGLGRGIDCRDDLAKGNPTYHIDCGSKNKRKRIYGNEISDGGSVNIGDGMSRIQRQRLVFAPRASAA